ncbi:hypothetical protein IWQ60_005744 [Tieghemiomyces parasiticus]|uniref:Alginate lyase domain-containing protein n=1 Tax=Tieghemiomyces parasiticus TaxID=78921 RepID=A0A9W8ABR0_9FUNG|nr:hypothetical protein IWQ60_005744 [Tieghemiomyces parasiticus]
MRHIASIPLVVALLVLSTAALEDAFLNVTALISLKATPGSQQAQGVLKRKADEFATKSTKYALTRNPAIPSSIPRGTYVSYAVYFHPDCSLPINKALTNCKWTRKDGSRNTEVGKLSDNPGDLKGVCDAVRTLSLAYGIYQDTRYATAALDILKSFFINPETAMLPNLDYGQIEPGTQTKKYGDKGRPAGLIESRCLGNMFIASQTLAKAPGAETTLAGVRKWVGSFVEWFKSSEIGKDEILSANNHGTAAAFQLAAFYTFLGDKTSAAAAINSFLKGAYLKQIAADGSMPLEADRNDGFHYSLMNLYMLINLAGVAESLGINMWKAPAGEGRTLQTAIDFYLPYAHKEKTFTNKGGQGVQLEPLVYPFQMAAAHYGDSGQKYRGAIQAIAKPSYNPTNQAYLYTDMSYGLSSKGVKRENSANDESSTPKSKISKTDGSKRKSLKPDST